MISVIPLATTAAAVAGPLLRWALPAITAAAVSEAETKVTACNARVVQVRSDARVAQVHRRIESPALADYLAVMSRALLQAGLSWAQIDRQWDNLASAFGNFEPAIVARYGAADIRRIAAVPGIVHSERKFKAIIHNAQVMLDLDKRHGGFGRYLRSFKNYDAACASIKQHFNYVGDISVYYFLFRVGERVPPFQRWIKTVKGEHPRVREMVTQKSGRS